MDLVSIYDLTLEDVHGVIRAALRDDLDTIQIEAFLGSVDWSGANKNRPVIADLLDELEHFTVSFDEGEMAVDAFVRALIRLLPTGGKTTFTLVPLRSVQIVPLGQFSQLPQTGSVTQAVPGSRLSESDSVQSLAATR
jgi:hypothetical protein